jgi:ribonuclease D
VPDTVDIELMSSERLRNALSAQDRIAIDTEFVRERTFFSQLCLVQIASGEDIYCVDPLADTASDVRAEFWELMMRNPWVLHSGRQDIEVIYQSAGAMPESVFDTQVAAALLGYAPQMGYAGMVAELFDVQLAKTHTRADWSKRPLTDALLEYAAEDVIYLLPARDLLCERLQQLGRLAWAEQDSADLLRPQLYDIDPDLAVARLKGARNLKGVMRSASVRLAAWREREAVRSNRPRQWIMKDKMLLDIAAGQPATREELAALPGMSPRTADRAAQDILAAVEAAKSDETDYKPPARPDAEQKALLKILQERVADLAGELGIANEIVAPRKELAAAVDGDRSGRVFSGWRAEIIGNELLGLLDS